MKWTDEWKPLAWISGIFILFYILPVGNRQFDHAVLEGLHLAKWYAREHVLLCLIPAFFIAGAIAVFLGQNSVMKYLGARANKILAYAVASVSGSILAVCSCTVLPLFAGIYRMGAGLGPACAFLYAGPAINVLAIVLTAEVLGYELGIARAVGAIIFSVVIGVMMQWFFRHDEKQEHSQMAVLEEEISRPLWQNALFFIAMIGILVCSNWGKPDNEAGFWMVFYHTKWLLTSGFALALAMMLILWFKMAWWKVASISLPVVILALTMPDMPILAFSAGILGFSLFSSTEKGEVGDWFMSSWDFAKQIFPLLLLGVLIAGMLLGRTGHEGLIPSHWIAGSVGGNSLLSNFVASFAGAFMYFATLTEVPILQGLINNGMGKGPALALLLAGPALSLPNMLVIRSVLGTRKTLVFITLVILMATVSGVLFGMYAT